MKKALIAIAAILAVSPFVAHAGDRLSMLSDEGFSAASAESFTMDDLSSTSCIRYRRRHEKAMSFIFEVSPWGLLSSPDIDGFSTSGTVDGTAVTETIDGKGSWMPTGHIGFGVNTRAMDFDFMVGGGYIGNDVFGSGFSELVFNPRFRFGPYVRFGPFASLMYIRDGNWRDESDIELEGGTAARGGASLAIGGRKVFFNLTATYLDFKYDVDTTSSKWTASSKTLDLSGWNVQMGIYCRF